jgi:hypothetical protein
MFYVRDRPAPIPLPESRYTGFFGISRSPIIKPDYVYLKFSPIAVYMSLSFVIPAIYFYARRKEQAGLKIKVPLL